MTAGKLPMPGVRERREGTREGQEDAALRGGEHPPQPQRQGWSENGFSLPAAGGGELQGRFSNSQQAGWASSNMHPLPRASRYVPGTPKHDSLRPAASSALGSSWIRRFLPTTAELGCQEVARTPIAVWEGAGAEAGAGGGAGEQSGFQLAGPLLLASAANEQHREQQEQEAGMSKHRIGLDSCKETAIRISGNGEYSMHKGKALLERERESRQRETNTAPQQRNLGENGVRASLRNVNTLLPSHPPPPSGTYPVEGSSRLQLELYEAGNHRTVMSTQRGGESHHGNGASGAMVMGFGPLRVVTKAPPTRVAGASGPKPDDVPDAAPQPDHHRLSNVTLLPDRKTSGNQPLTASLTGTKFTSLPISKSFEDPPSGRPFRAVEFAGCLRFPKQTKPEVEPAFGGGRPFMVPQADGARDNTTTMVVSGGLKQAEPQPAVRFNPFGEPSFKPRMETGHHMKIADPESGVDRMKMFESGVERIKTGFPFNYPSAPAHLNNMERKDDGRQGTENKFHNRVAAEDASARPSSGVGAGFQVGVEKRKMKELVGCGFSSKRHAESGPSHQRQRSPEIPSYPSYHAFQGDLSIGKAGHTLPGSPHDNFPGKDNDSGEDGKKSPFTNFFGAPKAYEDRLNGRAAYSPSEQQQPPWTSLYAAFKGREEHPEQANVSCSIPTLPADVHSRLQDGSANPAFEEPEANGVHDDHSGGDERMNDDDHLPESPNPSRFDNNQGQSSHFSSSPWPDDEGYIPNDEAGSAPYSSQAAGSGQASRVANPRGSANTKGRFMSLYGYDTGSGEREGFGGAGREDFGAVARCRDSYPGEPDYRKNAGNHGEGGHQMSHEANQAHGFSTPPLKHSATPPKSGHKDDTSDSSPPSYPPVYNSSEMGSPVLPRGIVDEHLLSIAGKLKHVEVDSEMEGSRVPRMQKGYRKEGLGFLSNKPKDSGAGNRDYKDVNAFLSKVPELQRAQRTTARESNREQGSRFGRPSEELEPGPKHGKLRMSSEAMGEEGGMSGPSKRSRHDSNDLGTEMECSGMPSSWLKRWLPPSPGNVAKSQAGFAKPKDNPRNGFTSEHARSTGNTHFMGGFSDDRSTQLKSAAAAAAARGKEALRANQMRSRMNGVKEISGPRCLNGLPPHPTPSAAAMALAGAAARKIGPFPQQRKGSVSMWPAVHLHTIQAPAEAQQTSRSSELSL